MLGAAIDAPAAPPADVLVEVLVASVSEAVVLRWRVGPADLAITGARAAVWRVCAARALGAKSIASGSVAVAVALLLARDMVVVAGCTTTDALVAGGGDCTAGVISKALLVTGWVA